MEENREQIMLTKPYSPRNFRFYSLWDTGYARVHIPIISSVSEHQPTTWTSFFFDLHVLVAVFPAGVWFCFAELNDLRVFAILYAIFASYFAGVMVRLILTLAPIVCVLASIAFSRLYDVYLRDDALAGDDGIDSSGSEKQTGKGAANQREKQLYDKPSKTASDKVICAAQSFFTLDSNEVLKQHFALETFVANIFIQNEATPTT